MPHRAWTRWIGLVLASLGSIAGCASSARGPAIPPARDGVPATFSSEAELRAYLAAARDARAPRKIRRGVISEADGVYPYLEVRERARPYVESAGGDAVVAASPMLVEAGSVWVTLDRGLSRAEVGGSALPAVADRFAMPEGGRGIVEAGLLDLGAVTAMVRNGCDGIDISRVPFEVQPLRICGRLVTEPKLVRMGDEIVFYGAFDAIGDREIDRKADDPSTAETGPTPPIVIPSVRAGGSERSIADLGPIHYPTKRVADVLVRVFLRCDLALSRCAARSFVSPRSTLDALWIDGARIALGYSDRDRSTVVQLEGRGEPVFASLDHSVIGLRGMADGRLGVVRADRPVLHPRSEAAPLIGVLDRQGRFESGPPLPPPVTGREGSWCWAIHGDRLIYGPARTHGLGGADTPRVVVAPFGSDRVDVQPITASVDAIHLARGDLVLVGATDKGVDTIARRALDATGSWTEHAYGSTWSLDRPGLEQAERSSVVVVGDRALVAVPFPDMTFASTYTLKLIELRADGLAPLGDVAASRGLPETIPRTNDDRLGAIVVGERLVLRLPGELAVVELDAGSARALGRIAL